MNYLKSSVFLICFSLFSCSSSSFKIIVDKDRGAEIIGTPDRFLPQCERVEMDDGTINYGFMIHFLDEEKTVGTATGMLTNKDACFKWKDEVHKILSNGKLIRLQGFGKLEDPRILEDFKYTFDKHGTFYGNGRSIDFFNIQNDIEECYSKYSEKNCSI